MVQRFDVSTRFAAGAQFIAGRLGSGSSARTHAVVDPATGEEVFSYELASSADVDAAVGGYKASAAERTCQRTRSRSTHRPST